MYIEKYAFFEDKIKGHNIFRIIEQKASRIFVTDKFVQTVKQNKLKGFRFSLVWDSEAED